MNDENNYLTKTEKSLLQRIGSFFSRNPSNSDEVADMLRSAENESIIDADALQIMEGALKVSDLQAREIMIPKSQMTLIESDFSLEKVLSVVTQSQHSRFPVIGESSDDVLGILLAKELIPLILQGKESFDLKNMLRPANVIPESKRISVLLKEFREQRYHMAIVIDEYAGVSGLLTIEDILEEIVGEIEDETDEAEPEQIIALKNNKYSVDAITEISDFNEYFDVGLPDDEFDTVGGLVIDAFGRLPEINEVETIDKFKFKVIAGDSRKITRVQVSLIK
ncbi:MAG: transporter associated domain-containing protein [Pseudomonadota bacterium]|jgi:magnesium and cobalt transporter|nr:CBS domain-containing protein [Pseudomonadales bacterium]MDP7404153.1 transporter associated domain-containing protein [Porticoccaceae bacterium]MEC7158513.1 transporter associated domain-containing protein [Pseudomonadota bacterium]MEC7455843.1 transporter associated domain-containing protein [Pseudomonadota bacterium]MEC7620156.1 transporter associated domain-containing protein [Pseudomonadota bacterium]|tara:strand:+ start:6460 stop:7299 length:840 start_codon:yes stop_codon:yes gene_type:complete